RRRRTESAAEHLVALHRRAARLPVRWHHGDGGQAARSTGHQPRGRWRPTGGLAAPGRFLPGPRFVRHRRNCHGYLADTARRWPGLDLRSAEREARQPPDPGGITQLAWRAIAVYLPFSSTTYAGIHGTT